MDVPVAGMKSRPYGENYLRYALLDLIVFSSQSPEFLAEFSNKTGHDLQSVLGAVGLEAMIDRATGHEQAVIASFCDYVVCTLWGEDEPAYGAM